MRRLPLNSRCRGNLMQLAPQLDGSTPTTRKKSRSGKENARLKLLAEAEPFKEALREVAREF